ncbi:MAG: hypothetical protein K0R55_3526 [Sporomusa sp.]|nr:hypothetical protein [Sporomusa sp.]
MKLNPRFRNGWETAGVTWTFGLLLGYLIGNHKEFLFGLPISIALLVFGIIKERNKNQKPGA